MEIHFTFRNVEPTEAIKNYAAEKIGRMQKFVRAPLTADVTLTLEKHLHCVDLTLRAGGDRWSASQESEGMYASIDLVVDKIDRQLRDAKAAATHRVRHAAGATVLSGKHGPPPEAE